MNEIFWFELLVIILFFVVLGNTIMVLLLLSIIKNMLKVEMELNRKFQLKIAKLEKKKTYPRKDIQAHINGAKGVKR